MEASRDLLDAIYAPRVDVLRAAPGSTWNERGSMTLLTVKNVHAVDLAMFQGWEAMSTVKRVL